jgi:hypothetical protein
LKIVNSTIFLNGLRTRLVEPFIPDSPRFERKTTTNLLQ